MAASPHVIGRLDGVHPYRAELGVCVASLPTTDGCMARARSSALLRADFHLVVHCTSGEVDQVVDFAPHRHGPDTLVWIRPGQVHERVPAIRGTVVCFTEDFLADHAALAPVILHGPTSWQLTPADASALRAHLGVLQSEHDRYVFGPTALQSRQGVDILRHCLAALLLRIGQAPAVRTGPRLDTHPVALVFVELVERSFAVMHTVEEYAAALGYSSKTLGRATVEATGLTPKQVVDARVLLEAKRLLAFTDLPLTTVGRRVGFEDPANFRKFFTRLSGESPAAFRASHAG